MEPIIHNSFTKTSISTSFWLKKMKIFFWPEYFVLFLPVFLVHSNGTSWIHECWSFVKIRNIRSDWVYNPMTLLWCWLSLLVSVIMEQAGVTLDTGQYSEFYGNFGNFFNGLHNFFLLTFHLLFPALILNIFSTNIL